MSLTKTENKLGLSWAKLNSCLANYAGCASCVQLDCLTCKNCQYRHIRHEGKEVRNFRDLRIFLLSATIVDLMPTTSSFQHQIDKT